MCVVFCIGESKIQILGSYIHILKMVKQRMKQRMKTEEARMGVLIKQ